MNCIKIAVPALAASLFALLASSHAYAEEMMCQPTLDNLADCVTHHYQMGQIFNKGTYKALISMVHEAVQARDSGDNEEAIDILNDFIHYVQHHTPKQIDPEAAEHMVMHASAAIEQLT